MKLFYRCSIALLISLTSLCNLRAQTNVILDDFWTDGTFTNWNLPTQAPWYYNSSSASTVFMGASPGSLFMTNYSPAIGNGTKTYWNYFTTNAPELTVNLGATNVISNTTNAFYGYPIDLAPGEMIKARLKFIPSGEFLTDGNSGVRFGLLSYDHADAGRATRNTSNISKSGTNVTGYRLEVRMYLNWTNDALMALHVRTNLNLTTGSGDPMGKAEAWLSLGASPSFTNVPGFQDGGLYTLDFSVTHYAASNVISSTISGPLAGVASTNFTRTTVDTSGSNYHKFDCFMVRVDTSTISADLFECKEFRVEKVTPAASVLPFRITSQTLPAANQFALTWDSASGQTYQVQSKDNLSLTGWATNATVTATSASTSWTNTALSGIPQRFYRVVATP
jgi:hypothetical protein